MHVTAVLVRGGDAVLVDAQRNVQLLEEVRFEAELRNVALAVAADDQLSRLLVNADLHLLQGKAVHVDYGFIGGADDPVETINGHRVLRCTFTPAFT